MSSYNCCYQSQNYKIWKQFTTILLFCQGNSSLLSIAKLQNLKAIHNAMFWHQTDGFVVINRKTTKFESNSQLERFLSARHSCCYQSQNYKIWKQFTTYSVLYMQQFPLLSIAKLQNLELIYNYILPFLFTILRK